MLLISTIRLMFDMAVVTIRLTIELLVIIGRLLGFLFRELVVPGTRAASEGLVALAGVVARRRAGDEQDWTSHDDRQLQQWRDGRRY